MLSGKIRGRSWIGVAGALVSVHMIHRNGHVANTAPAPPVTAYQWKCDAGWAVGKSLVIAWFAARLILFLAPTRHSP